MVPVLPANMKGCPHTYLEYLNGGLLPYHDRSKPLPASHPPSLPLYPLPP